MNRASAREAPAEESKSGSAAAAGNNSAAAGFKAFAGKGKSIGGAPIEVPRYDSQGASASRGRSTPATRDASAAASSMSSSSNDDSASKENAPNPKAPGARAGSALIAKLEEKKRQEAEQADP